MVACENRGAALIREEEVGVKRKRYNIYLIFFIILILLTNKRVFSHNSVWTEIQGLCTIAEPSNTNCSPVVFYLGCVWPFIISLFYSLWLTL